MGTNSITIQYVPPAGAPDPSYWLRFEGVEETLAVSIGEAAELVDSVYDREPCDQELPGGKEAELTEDGTPEPPLSKDELIERANEVLGLRICEDAGTSVVKVKVIRSHDLPYNLKLTNGTEVSRTRQTEEKVLSLSVSKASSVDLEYPIKDLKTNLTVQPDVFGSILYFGAPITDTFTASFSFDFDLVEVEVPNNTDGSPGECRAIAFYNNHVYQHDLEVPDPDDQESGLCDEFGLHVSATVPGDAECYQLVHQVKRCVCSDTEVERETVEQSVPCPEGELPGKHLEGSLTVTVERVDCGESDIGLNDPAYYEDLCCEEPNRSLPTCLTTKKTFPGGHGIYGGPEKYLSLYGKNTRIIPVGPAQGPCGEHTARVEVRPKICCDEVISTPLRLVRESTVDVLADNSSGIVTVADGLDRIEWRVYGGDIWLDPGHTVTKKTMGRVAQIYSGDICGTVMVTATDGCTTVTHYIRAENGYWRQFSQEEIFNHGIQNATVTSFTQKLGTLCGSNTYVLTADTGRFRYHKTVYSWYSSSNSNSNTPPQDCSGADLQEDFLMSMLDVYDPALLAYSAEDNPPWELVDMEAIRDIITPFYEGEVAYGRESAFPYVRDGMYWKALFFKHPDLAEYNCASSIFFLGNCLQSPGGCAGGNFKIEEWVC